MDCQNHQFLDDFNAVQLFLHFEQKKVLLELSEGHCSIVITEFQIFFKISGPK